MYDAYWNRTADLRVSVHRATRDLRACASVSRAALLYESTRVEIHHLAHRPYTSNTLRVSQLTPSQTFHFVVQRARHGARWFPQVGAFAVRCYSLFLVSKEHGEMGIGQESMDIHGP